MKTKLLLSVGATAVILAVCGPVFAHHGAAAYEMSKPVELKGATVTKFEWINPHPLIKVDAKDDKGVERRWIIETGSTAASMLIGWTRSTLRPGDVVDIFVWQAKSGLPVGRLNKVILANGTMMRDTQTGADNGGRADTGVGR